jgi:ATP synthase I chain
MDPATPSNELGVRTNERISRLTLILGFAAALAVFFLKSHSYAAGIAVGTVLAWLNFRWLDQALVVMERQATVQQDAPAVRVPRGTYAKVAGRYLLMAAAIYVTVHYFAVPLVSLIVGLLALGAGAFAASIYEVILGS